MKYSASVFFAEAREQDFELLGYEGKELWILVDGDGDLNESVRAILLKFAHPVGYGFYIDAKCFGGLLIVPAPGGFMHEDGHTFGWRIIRAVFRRDLGHTVILDADLFLE